LAPCALIVEDVPEEAEVLGRLLAGHGWAARWARTVRGARIPDAFWVRRFGTRARGGELAAAPDGTLLALFPDPGSALEAAAALRGEGLRRGDPPGMGLAEGPVFRRPHGGPEWAFYAIAGPAAEAARRLARLAPAGILLLEPALQSALPPGEAGRALPWADAPAWLRPIPLRWPA
jgi:hypothetical protein